MINIMAADFINENFTNIGGFTLEHLNDIMLKIKKENTTLERKSKIPYSLAFTDQNEQMKDSTFFTSYFSSSLIFSMS